MNKNKRRTKPQEAVSGSYTPLPHALLDSTAFMGASTRAKAMLLELVRQHNGRNNGHLQLSVGWLRKRGWSSTSAIQLAKAELLKRDLAILTKRGGLNAGPDYYALTWLPIGDYSGLDLKQGSYAPGAWRFADPLPVMTNRKTPAPNTRGKKREASSDARNSTVPIAGTGRATTVPAYGTKTPRLCMSTVPSTGNNEVTSSLSAFTSIRNGWKFSGRINSSCRKHPISIFHRIERRVAK